MADLATKISLTPKPEGVNILMRLIQSRAWSDLLDLTKFNHVLTQDGRLPIEATISKELKAELKWLGEKIKELDDSPEDDLKEDSDEELSTHFVVTNHAISLVENGLLVPTLMSLLKQSFDLRQRLIDSLEIVDSLSDERLKAKLMLLSHITGPVHPCERHWKRFGRGPKVIMELWRKKINVKLCEKLAEQFFEQKMIPKVIQQRLSLARYLFNQHFWTKEGLGPKYSKIYEEAFDKSLKLQSACTLDLLRTQDQSKAKKIHYQLKWTQSLLPPHAIVDFASAYFEFRFLPPVSQNEDRILALTQAEQQLPETKVAFSTRASQRPKLIPYLQGLVKKIAESKSLAYVEDERVGRCLDDVLKGLRSDWAWSAKFFYQHAPELLCHVQEEMGDDESYYANLLFLKHQDGHDSIQEHVHKAASLRFDKSVKLSEDSSDDGLFRGMTELSRSLQLGYPLEDADNLLKQYISRIEEGKNKRLQSLSLEVGSALGEVLSTRSLSSEKQSAVAKGSVGDHLQHLYETFKDVMLQQDPFASESKKALEDILAQANSLVEEAKSIETSRSGTVWDDILSGEDKEGARLLLNDPKSMKNLCSLLFFDPEKLEQAKVGFKIPPEQSLMHTYSDFLTHVASRQIKNKNNPLLQHFGVPLQKWINYGAPPLDWWGQEPEAFDIASELFIPPADEEQSTIRTDRYVICRMFEWLRFENEEALKVPYRKAMSVTCSHITNGIVSTRKLAQENFDALIGAIKLHDPSGMLVQMVDAMRKASAQISSLEIMKKSGILPVKFDRSIEPRVRNFLETCTKKLLEASPKVFRYVQERVPAVYALDKSEFMLGTILGEKEKALKRYLHMNLDELTQSYLRTSNKGSLPNKINNTCLRVQQGINFRRSDARNLRYCPVVLDDDHSHTPESVEKRLNAFEEMFPIIDRISGSRQTINENELLFHPEDQGISEDGLPLYRELIDRYLDNALKLARQLRIMIIPGQGTGNYDHTSHTLCIPMHTGLGRTEDMTLLTALADYLYHVKVINEGSDIEEELCAILNKKTRSSLKAGTHDAQLKVTQLLYQELGALAGLDRLQRNPASISGILGRAILGTDQTMIYRELRELSAPQKQQRYKTLRARYACDKKIIPFAERVADVAASYLNDPDITTEYKKQHATRIYHRLPESCRQLIREEIYDLGVLLYHYSAFNQAYQAFEFLTKVEPDFPEGYWGLGTSSRHIEMNLLSLMQKQSTAISAFKRFGSIRQVGPFWKKRANDLSKKLSEEMV
jgi:hypothetical protein